MLRPSTIDDVCAVIRGHEQVRVCGAGSKPGLSAGANVSVSELNGVVEYDPREFVVTVQAGMPVAALMRTLAERGQVLPFDPPFADRGATVGGTIASGVSGAGRARYGGVRDFLLGVTFVNAEGVVVRGGGRVVKNAAGFDLPKLMIGSGGDLGIMVEATFKVFPAPEHRATVIAEAPSFEVAHASLLDVGRGATELESLDLEGQSTLAVRVGGRGAAVRATAERLAQHLAGATHVLAGDDDERYWRQAGAFAWAPPDSSLLKSAIRPTALPTCERACTARPGVRRRYSAGGHLAWVALPSPAQADDLRAFQAAWPGPLMGLSGSHAHLFQMPRWSGPFGSRLRHTFDPHGKFSTPTASHSG